MSQKQNKDYAEYSFPGQHKGEQVEAIMRLHPVVMRRGLIWFTVLFALGSLPILLKPDYFVLLWVVLIGFLLGCAMVFKEWMKWYYTLLLVTDVRFLQMRQKGLFSNSVIEVELSKIQNVNYQIDGLEQTMLGFGTINVQTFAGDLVIKNVQKPKQVQNVLNQAVYKYKEQ